MEEVVGPSTSVCIIFARDDGVAGSTVALAVLQISPLGMYGLSLSLDIVVVGLASMVVVRVNGRRGSAESESSSTSTAMAGGG